MNPEIQKLKDEIQKLSEGLRLLESAASIPLPVEEAFRERLDIRLIEELPQGLSSAPLAAITAPSGGITIDSEGRTAINLIISRLEDLGLLNAN